MRRLQWSHRTPWIPPLCRHHAVCVCVCELSNILSSQEKLEVIGSLGAIEASPHFEVRALTSTLMIKSHFHALVYCHLKELLHSYSKCLHSRRSTKDPWSSSLYSALLVTCRALKALVWLTGWRPVTAKTVAASAFKWTPHLKYYAALNFHFIQ